MTRLCAVLLPVILACGSCAADPGPLPAVPTPAQRGAASWWSDTTNRFFDAVRPVVGDAPLECNGRLRERQTSRVHVTSPVVLAAWFDCAKASRAAGKSFLILIEHVGIDNWAATGILGQRDG